VGSIISPAGKVSAMSTTAMQIMLEISSMELLCVSSFERAASQEVSR